MASDTYLSEREIGDSIAAWERMSIRDQVIYYLDQFRKDIDGPMPQGDWI